MRRSSSGSRIRAFGTSSHRISPLILVCALGLIATIAGVVVTPVSFSQEKIDRAPVLSWNPPHVYDPVPLLSTTPPCDLHNVLKHAGQRAQELIDHLQNFNALEHVRYEEIDRDGLSETSLSGKFDYLVDFAEQSRPLAVREIRSSFPGADNTELNSRLDTGLPALALIFHPSMQDDYEMRCEGLSHWNNQLAWVVYFSQIPGKKPRAISVVTPLGTYPLSIRGRAWIAADSGHLIHLETNLVKSVPVIGLRANAASIDYAPVKFSIERCRILAAESRHRLRGLWKTSNHHRAHIFRLPAFLGSYGSSCRRTQDALSSKFSRRIARPDSATHPSMIFTGFFAGGSHMAVPPKNTYRATVEARQPRSNNT